MRADMPDFFAYVAPGSLLPRNRNAPAIGRATWIAVMNGECSAFAQGRPGGDSLQLPPFTSTFSLAGA
jgi:hypothetical protein